jgi:hypothetical protein
MKRKTEKEKVEAAAVEMIETPLELIKSILLKHNAAMIEVMRDRLAQPEKEWQGLTDEEIRDLWSWAMTAEAERTATTQQHAFARAIEDKLRSKNT